MVRADGALALVLRNHPTVGAVALVLGIALAVLIILAVLAAGPTGRAAGRATRQATP
ncbi:hypothetical protein ACWCQ0_33955 [Streptomyces massasporeus]|uniref:Uncharacterized protein n=1 Tax=Streptomyces massasporeus TaxID=67324 RepID=A0ABW6LLD8_9ACTN